MGAEQTASTTYRNYRASLAWGKPFCSRAIYTREQNEIRIAVALYWLLSSQTWFTSRLSACESLPGRCPPPGGFAASVRPPAG